MTSERDKIIQHRNRLKFRFGQLFTEVEQILFRHDPMEIAFVDHDDVAENPDEYAPEVETIIPRLDTANSAEDVADIVYEEFLHWFGLEETDDEDVDGDGVGEEELTDEDLVGPKAAYADLSAEIWAAWIRFKAISATH